MTAFTNKVAQKLQTPSSGFTLIELMVTIAVLAIIVGIAAPSISTQLANQRVKSTTATLANALKEAKNESLIRRQLMELSFDNSKHLIIIKSASSNNIAQYTYSDKNTVKADKTTIVFRPSKNADEVTYTVCDIENPSVKMQVVVTALASISTVAGGTC